MTYGYKERGDVKRAAFVKKLNPISVDDIVYADESGMDNRTDYGYGYSPKGERLHALKSGRREGRINMIAALCNHQLLAPFTIEGACNRQVFETWIEACLIPALKPGQILVIDNATFHKGGGLQNSLNWLAVRFGIYPLIRLTSIRLSRVGHGSKVGFVNA